MSVLGIGKPSRKERMETEARLAEARAQGRNYQATAKGLRAALASFDAPPVGALLITILPHGEGLNFYHAEHGDKGLAWSALIEAMEGTAQNIRQRSLAVPVPGLPTATPPPVPGAEDATPAPKGTGPGVVVTPDAA